MRAADHLQGLRHTFSSQRVRVALTLLGIIIGSGTIVLLAGLLRGGKEALLVRSQQANEEDLVQVKRDDPPPSREYSTRRELSRRDAEALSALDPLKNAPVASEATREARALYRDKQKRVRLVTASPATLELYRLGLARGRYLADEDFAGLHRVCVVGHEIWRELLDERPSIEGVSLTILGEKWTVVGVLENKPMIGGGDGTWMWNRKVLVPETTFDAVFNPNREVGRIFLRLDGLDALASRLRPVEKLVRATLLRRHFGVANFLVEGEGSFANQERLILMVIELLLLGTALLSLFVGGINIMNIMLVTVTERTREIGVRRALGATPGNILVQFLLEAATVAAVGGLLGVSAGVGGTWAAASLLRKWAGTWNMYVEPWSIVLGLVLSLVTGVVFGLLPALRAARLDPVAALRYE